MSIYSTINPMRRLRKALVDLLQTEGEAANNPAATKHERWLQEVNLEQKKQAFIKAQKRVKRERSHKQLRDLGLMD